MHLFFTRSKLSEEAVGFSTGAPHSKETHGVHSSGRSPLSSSRWYRGFGGGDYPGFGVAAPRARPRVEDVTCRQNPSPYAKLTPCGRLSGQKRREMGEKGRWEGRCIGDLRRVGSMSFVNGGSVQEGIVGLPSSTAPLSASWPSRPSKPSDGVSLWQSYPAHQCSPN